MVDLSTKKTMARVDMQGSGLFEHEADQGLAAYLQKWSIHERMEKEPSRQEEAAEASLPGGLWVHPTWGPVWQDRL